MKLKGINPFEQHAEKIIAGVVGAAFLGVLAMQFLTEPNKVQVGTGAPLPPDRAYEPVKAAAQKLLAAVESKEPELPPVTNVNVLDGLKGRLNAPIAPRDRLIAMGPVVMLEESEMSGGTADTLIAQLAVPAPELQMARTHRAAIDPMEAISIEGLAAYLPKEQPFDKASVSVEATFSGEALKALLATDPDGDAGPIRAIPLGWWRDAIEIVGVELERERLQSDGTWVELAIIPPIPGRIHMLSQAKEWVRGPGDMPRFVEMALQNAADIRTPAFYSVIAGPTWAAPTEAEGGTDAGTIIDKKQKALNQVLADIARFEKAQAAAEKRQGRDAENAGNRGGGGGESRSRSTNKGGGGGDQPDPDSRSRETVRERGGAPAAEKKTELQRKMEKAELDREKLQREIEELTANAARGSQLRDNQERVTPMLDESQTRVWGHDLTAVPGQQYRYRVRVLINNPFFGRQASLRQEQQELAKSAFIPGEWSAWSDNVVVDPNETYFITSAAQGDSIGGPRASAEMYRFYYGFWRRGSTTVEPGDPLIAEAKLPANLLIYDVAKLKTAGTSGGGSRRELDGGDPRDSRNADDEGGKGRANDRFEGEGREYRESEPAAGDALADAGTPALSRLPFAVDAILLDVSAGAALSQGTTPIPPRAFFTNQAGLISVRMPDDETKTDLYRRVSESAKAGENQGRPKVKPFTAPTGPTAPVRPEPEAPDDSGGGGGGG